MIDLIVCPSDDVENVNKILGSISIRNTFIKTLKEMIEEIKDENNDMEKL